VKEVSYAIAGFLESCRAELTIVGRGQLWLVEAEESSLRSFSLLDHSLPRSNSTEWQIQHL